MHRIKRFLKRIRLVYRRSSILTKAVVLSAIVLSMAALITIQLSTGAAQDRTKELADQAAQLEHDNQQLEDRIDDLGSADSVKDIAGENGYVDGDTVIIEPEE